MQIHFILRLTYIIQFSFFINFQWVSNGVFSQSEIIKHFPAMCKPFFKMRGLKSIHIGRVWTSRFLATLSIISWRSLIRIWKRNKLFSISSHMGTIFHWVSWLVWCALSWVFWLFSYLNLHGFNIIGSHWLFSFL